MRTNMLISTVPLLIPMIQLLSIIATCTSSHPVKVNSKIKCTCALANKKLPPLLSTDCDTIMTTNHDGHCGHWYKVTKTNGNKAQKVRLLHISNSERFYVIFSAESVQQIDPIILTIDLGCQQVANIFNYYHGPLRFIGQHHSPQTRSNSSEAIISKNEYSSPLFTYMAYLGNPNEAYGCENCYGVLLDKLHHLLEYLGQLRSFKQLPLWFNDNEKYILIENVTNEQIKSATLVTTPTITTTPTAPSPGHHTQFNHHRDLFQTNNLRGIILINPTFNFDNTRFSPLSASNNDTSSGKQQQQQQQQQQQLEPTIANDDKTNTNITRGGHSSTFMLPQSVNRANLPGKLLFYYERHQNYYHTNQSNEELDLMNYFKLHQRQCTRYYHDARSLAYNVCHQIVFVLSTNRSQDETSYQAHKRKSLHRRLAIASFIYWNFEAGKLLDRHSLLRDMLDSGSSKHNISQKENDRPELVDFLFQLVLEQIYYEHYTFYYGYHYYSPIVYILLVFCLIVASYMAHACQVSNGPRRRAVENL